MAVFLAFLVFILAMAGYSNAAYCLCKDGVSNDQYQKDIDYACGNGADCSAINQTGSCYNPITVKDHCNYAVNSYYQRKAQIAGSCDFSGTAIISQTVPSNVVSGCVYPSSSSNAGTVTPTNPATAPAPPGNTTNPPVTVTPTNPGTAPPGNTNPGTAPPGNTNPGIAPPGNNNPGTTTPNNPLTAPPGSTIPSGGGTTTPGFGLGPSTTSISPDNSASGGVCMHHGMISFASLVSTIVVYDFICFMF